MAWDFFNILKYALIFFIGVFVLAYIVAYALREVDALSYRLMVIFLFSIFISNLGSKLIILYIKQKK